MRLLIIVTGSIAISKLPEMIKLLKKKKIKIDFIFTKSALSIMKSKQLLYLKNFRIYTDKLQKKKYNEMLHIELSRKADAIMIFPASANIIGKFSNGIADDLASTTLLVSNKQLFFIPAMNTEMWENTSNQDNVKKLKKNGHIFIGPIYGNLSCGEVGIGRISNIETIVNEINLYLSRRKILSGLTGIITAGPTIEKIDSIRYISNYSSGKQGYSIAKILSLMGANIKLVSGKTNLSKPPNINLIDANSAKEMNEAVMDLLPADFAVCTAAVVDHRPKNFSYSKKKKDLLNLIPLEINPDILFNISNAKNKRPSLVVGFAAETTNIKTNARQKLNQKKCDWILANKISKKEPVFGSDNNSIHFFSKKNYEKWPKMSKIQVALKLNSKIYNFFNKINEN